MLDLRRQTGCTAIGIRNPDKAYMINPGADSLLIEGAHLIVLGRRKQIMKLRELF
jgi:voltage-gated potassium channel